MATILVVDDCEDTLALLEATLGSGGHEVHLATCWEEALEVIGEEEVEAVLLDVQLGAMNGDQVALLLGRFTSLEAPILFHSSLPEEELAALVERTGVHGFLRKGGRGSEVLARLEEALGARS